MDFRWIFNLKIRGVDFSKMFRGFTESGRNNTTPQGKQNTFGERSERASAASEASGAIQVFGSIFFRIFGEIHGNRRKEHDNVGKTTIIIRASRSMSNQFYVGVFFRPKTHQDGPRWRPSRAKTRPRCAQDALRRFQDAPRRAQDAPRCA